MTYYIAELDESQNVIAVWVKEKSARAPRVFDPQKHVFDTTGSIEYCGAPKEKIESWISQVKTKSGSGLSR